MDLSKLIYIVVAGLLISGTAIADTGDRVEQRFDERGDRIEDRLDERGDRIDSRLDRKAARAEANGREQDIAIYRERRELRQSMMSLVGAARADLREIYTASVDDEQKRLSKQTRLEQLSADVGSLLEESGRERSSWFSGELNNARLISMTLYEGRLPEFRVLLEECAQRLDCFYDKAKELARR